MLSHPDLPSRQGFTAIPRRVFDRLLCLDLTQRELKVLLLVVRLTYGCRNARWAALRQADLAAVGIGANHARACLQGLLCRGLLLRGANRNEYRLNPDFRPEAEEERQYADRRQRLDSLVAGQLASISRKRNSGVPGKGTPSFPNREREPSPKGNREPTSAARLRRSGSSFAKAADVAKDRLNTGKTDKNRDEDGFGVRAWRFGDHAVCRTQSGGHALGVFPTLLRSERARPGNAARNTGPTGHSERSD